MGFSGFDGDTGRAIHARGAGRHRDSPNHRNYGNNRDVTRTRDACSHANRSRLLACGQRVGARA